MANPDEQRTKSQFETLGKDAVIDVLLPRSTELDVCTTLREGSYESLQRVPARRNLFFGSVTMLLNRNNGLPIARITDERAVITLVLKTSSNEDDVRTIVSSLEIALSAHATDAVPQGTGNTASASGKHDLTSKTVPAGEFTDVISRDGATYVVWKPVLHLPRPRVRLQRPAVYFTVSLSISATAVMSTTEDKKDYLTSLQPLPANVLEALKFDPSLGSFNIQLSETRITKVAPATGRMLDDIKPVRGATKRAFPIVPALFTRVRYSALPSAVLASLHLETSQVTSGILWIEKIDFDVSNANVESLSAMQWPLESLSGDETILLYKLTERARSTPMSAATVYVRMSAAVLSEEGSRMDLDVRWQAQVDLSQTSVKPTYRWSRPLSVSGGQSVANQPASTVYKSSPDTSQQGFSGEQGVTFNFWAPSTIPSKIDFKINVQCINRSGRSRRFALVVVRPKKTTARPPDNSSLEDTDVLTNIFNAPPVERQKPPDVLNLNADVRIGPLLPGACYETGLRFWAATTGVLDLGFVRIVDLDTRQTVDVKELPDVVVLDPSEE